MDCSTPGFAVHHYPPEFVQAHVHWVSDVIQPSHPLSSSSPLVSFSQRPFPGSFPKSQLLASGGQNIGASTSASVLPMNIQGWFPLGLTGLIILLSLGQESSQESFSTIVWKHQFFGAQPSLWSSSRIHTWLLVKPYLWLYGLLVAK